MRFGGSALVYVCVCIAEIMPPGTYFNLKLAMLLSLVSGAHEVLICLLSILEGCIKSDRFFVHHTKTILLMMML